MVVWIELLFGDHGGALVSPERSLAGELMQCMQLHDNLDG
jgi:hypothetical protein